MSCVTTKYTNSDLGFLNTLIMVLFVLIPVAIIIISNSYILGKREGIGW